MKHKFVNVNDVGVYYVTNTIFVFFFFFRVVEPNKLSLLDMELLYSILLVCFHVNFRFNFFVLHSDELVILYCFNTFIATMRASDFHSMNHIKVLYTYCVYCM